MAEKIVIDAGHNGLTDPGAVYNGRRESDDVLSLAQTVGDLLMQNGYEVEYTRTGNLNQSVVQKAQFANQTGADLFVSLHRNMASYPGQYNGVQTLLYDLSGLKQVMAENINQNLENVGYRNINVEARPDLAVLRRTQMPALLVEVGFIDSTIDNQLFDTRFDQTAQAIADGIIDTLNAANMTESDWMNMTAPVMPGRPNPIPPQMQPGSMQNPMPGNIWNPTIGNSRPLYRVQVGAFYNLQNAIDLEQELKRLGYNTWIVTV